MGGIQYANRVDELSARLFGVSLVLSKTRMTMRFYRAWILVFLMSSSAAPAKPLGSEKVREVARKIDQLLAADFAEEGKRLNGFADESTYLRRVYLGVVGRIPNEQEARDYLDSKSKDKAAVLIDQLVDSKGFDSHLFNWAADLLRVQTEQEQFGLGWHIWLRDSLSENVPWDQLVNEMLSADGLAARNPAVGYYVRDRNMPLDNFSNTMQVFLGRQIGCAQCHDHPFDDWSQMDYYKMAAFGGGRLYRSQEAVDTIERVVKDLRKQGEYKPEAGKKKGKQLRRTLRPLFQDLAKNSVSEAPRRNLKLPLDYKYSDGKPEEVVSPETMFGPHITNIPAAQRRQAFADWVTSLENPYFTKVIVNRMWARAFGRGLLEPLDDWGDSSEPAHREVFTYLEELMHEVNFDLREFTRVLYHTEYFRRQSEAEDTIPAQSLGYRGPVLRRMSAEQLFDSMIILKESEVQEAQSPNKKVRWENYTQAVEMMLAAESKELFTLAEVTAQAEAEFREARNKVRENRRNLAEAKTSQERKQTKQTMKQAQKEMNELRKRRNPMAMMSASMSLQMDTMTPKMRKGLKNQTGQGQRASEHSAPFRPGTLVREFGGSDRSVPSSGHTIPTVPQALALLNDPQTDLYRKGDFSLRKRLDSVSDIDEKLNILFLRLYSKYPSDKEVTSYRPFLEKDDTAYELVRAMLTSDRFIFIQ